MVNDLEIFTITYQRKITSRTDLIVPPTFKKGYNKKSSADKSEELSVI